MTLYSVAMKFTVYSNLSLELGDSSRINLDHRESVNLWPKRGPMYVYVICTL